MYSLAGNFLNQIHLKTWDYFTFIGSSFPNKATEPQIVMTCAFYLWIFPLEDYQCQVQLWSLILGWHATYASIQALIIFPYLRYEQLIISYLFIVHNVHNDLPQVFTKPIGFTTEGNQNFIISWHCCGVGFWLKCWAKCSKRRPNSYCIVPFDPHIGIVVPLFLECVYCFPHTPIYRFWTLPCKLHNMLYIHLHRHIYFYLGCGVTITLMI